MAPSPTGAIHVGTARTALFNFLFARHNDGEFLFRVEDTDVERSRDEHIASFMDTLHWLGMDWDEEPMRQSRRFDIYIDAANRLLADGHAYECYCTEDEVRERNDAALAAGKTPGYDGRCRDLTDEQRAAYAAEGRPRSVRFRTPDDGASTFDDVIRGQVSVEWVNIPDFVIVRSNGAPVFFLANAVDDAAQGITHALRGADILDTTHRVLAIRNALGITEPITYAHLPLILAPEGGKLSKRHGAVAVEEFREAGYLPEAIINYIALLGWAPPDDREVLSLDEMIDLFSLERVSQSSAVFDPQKLLWLNGEHLRRLPLDELIARLEPEAKSRFGRHFNANVFAIAVGLGQERATTTNALLDQMVFLFVDDADFTIAEASWEKLVETERVGEIFEATAAHLATCDWNAEAIDLRPVLDGLGIKARKGMPAIYAAVEGSHTGLPLFDSIGLLGRDRAIARITAAQLRLG
jgi:glutamyl-tRNA synthetase